MNTENMRKQVIDTLKEKICFQENDGIFYGTFDADYRDTMSTETALSILNDDNPRNALFDVMEEWYSETQWDMMNDIESEVATDLGMVDTDLISDIISDMVCIDYPTEHFLAQKFCANILIDTGDGNYDFVLNSVYPAYCGDYDEVIDEKASLVWLARTQGYSKDELWMTLQEGDITDEKSFLKSVRAEVANETGHMNILVFLVELTLEQLINLKGVLSKSESQEKYLVVDKDTMTGLYDPWYGGGSILGIQLEKGVKIPFKYIRSILPDGGDGYGIKDIYGMCESVWKYGGVKQFPV